MIDILKTLDTELFLYLNSQNSAFFDFIMYLASDKLFWIPFYLLMAILILKVYKKRAVLIFVFIGALITLSDQISSGLLKPWIQRLRPSHNPEIIDLVHLSQAGPGGIFGFVSGHATNSFALFVFLSVILNKKFNTLKYILCFWALLVSYSRIYVGVHYPGDVLGGALLGTVIAYCLSIVYEHVTNIKCHLALRPYLTTKDNPLEV